MKRSELIAALSRRFPLLSQDDTRIAVMTILEGLASAVAAGRRIEIRDFGSFRLLYRAPRRARDLNTGAAVRIPAKYKPHFKPGKELRERVGLCQTP
jgi:integration host factor subunit beta